jgi:hypothetical protein
MQSLHSVTLSKTEVPSPAFPFKLRRDEALGLDVPATVLARMR